MWSATSIYKYLGLENEDTHIDWRYVARVCSTRTMNLMSKLKLNIELSYCPAEHSMLESYNVMCLTDAFGLIYILIPQFKATSFERSLWYILGPQDRVCVFLRGMGSHHLIKSIRS